MFEEQLKALPPDPPRPLQALPGLALSRSVPAMALLFPLLFLIFFLSVPLSMVQSDPTMRFAMSPTGSLQGRVLSSENTSACRSDKAHRVIYQFSPAPGTSYRGKATVCEQSVYYTVKEGDAVEVQYLRNDPVVSRLRGPGLQNTLPLYLFLFTPLFILAMLASVWWIPLREVRRARALFRNGKLATGAVIFVRRRSNTSWRGWSGSVAADVFIEFETPVGERREGVAWCANDWLINQLIPGKPVHVAYDDSNKLALLEAFLR